MMAIEDEEVKARLEALTQGPWASGVVKARRDLAPVDNIPSTPSGGTKLIALDLLDLSASNKRKSGRLARVLRPHFEYHGVVGGEEYIETRDALDQALTLPQLYELAVQTGYLPESTVRKPARTILKDLLWSAPARRFVAAYDYVAVPMLAARVGISGLVSTKAPEPNPRAALRFAGFLAHLRAFYIDEQIDVWVRFLDDYVVQDNEQEMLREYLQGKRKTPPSRMESLLAGCQLFVTSLASAFHILSENEMGPFGLIHSYWLQKFFGYKRDGKGLFVKNTALWGRTDSWARTISTSRRVLPEGTGRKLEEILRRQFVEQVRLLDRTFEAVRRLARETRLPTLGTTGRTPEVL